jgi:hypothetical protein
MKHTYTLWTWVLGPREVRFKFMHEEIGSHQQTTEGEAGCRGEGYDKKSALND